MPEKNPLWNYVTILEKFAGGGNVRFQCHYCHKIYVGSLTRVRGHLLQQGGSGTIECDSVQPSDKAELTRTVDEYKLRVQNSMPKQVPLPTFSFASRNMSGSSSSSHSSIGLQNFTSSGVSQSQLKRKKTGGDTSLEKAFNLQARHDMDSEIARLFYSSGIPFNVARNPHYFNAFSKAANSKNLNGYVPPGYNALRTTLLQKERAHIERLLEPIKSTWPSKGVSIVSDGWTDAQRRPIINIMATCESGPMFLKAINCEGEYKDKHFIAKILIDIIKEVGAQNVVQVITDNAPVCRAAGLLVESQFQHILWVPCVVHTLNLALKNICSAKNTDANMETYMECHWITEVIGDVMVIKNFIMNHSMRLSMFNEFSHLKMLSVAETRFASSIIMLRRFKVIKQGLLNMVISPNWTNYKEDDNEKAKFIRDKIIGDSWWDLIEYILSFTEPIYDMLRKADTDKPSLHLVYDMWDSMIENVKSAIYRHEGKRDDEESSFYLVVHTILMNRWGKSNTPLHCLAHSLNPRYYSSEWLSVAPNHVPPHKDDEISRRRAKCFEKYLPNVVEHGQVKNEFAKFSAALREFASYDSISDRAFMDPDLWWVTHGSSSSLLQNLALNLLGQPCSSSYCEHNWSTYSFVNSLKRNRITPKRGEDLVFIHSNLRLLSRQTLQYAQGSMWDASRDAFDSLDGVCLLEIANLSLDEPEMEAIIFIKGNVEDENELFTSMKMLKD